MTQATGAVANVDRKPLKRRLLALVSAIALFPAAAMAETTAEPEIYGTPTGLPFNLSGSYLSGRLAGFDKDYAQAAAFYEETLAADPNNTMLLERTFLLKLANGDVEQAVDFAEELEKAGLENFLAQLAIGAQRLIDGSYTNADIALSKGRNGPLAQLSIGISRAWALYGNGKVDEAVETIDELSGPEWFEVFKATHKAHLLFAAGRNADALEAIEGAYAIDQGAIRVIDAYARILAANGRQKEALEVLDQYDQQFRGHPKLVDTRETLMSGEVIPPMVTDPSQGMAEILYGLGAVIGRDGGEELSTSYLQLALHLDPKAEFAAIALGSVFERMEQPERAIKALMMVPEDSVLKREAEIQVGMNFNALDKLDEARSHLEVLIEQDPSDLEAVIALGNILRSHEIYDDAETTYTQGLDTIAELEDRHWIILYFRGIARERLDKWDLAEADFRKALELNENQPLVLNYLGYSLVDQGLKLDEALDMIKTAVELRPTDGYIVDSLGWVYFRLGRYEEAVKELERAIELRPADPVINDHLGDAYWMVGRRNEARFQWNHARDLGPEEDELPKIRDKIANGLKDVPVTDAANAETKNNGG
ncbi:tetratricopeptide repeat protein [uncultured Roseibium sp.]|uniref:tetratricopeptide repeat protein n=1 Tax=uncultured Roseibium sp. TaxID=1936171 RepID=UPI0026337BB1|nr:tetratricopeptide repeat protein [uncultured Roseibium sp.]